MRENAKPPGRKVLIYYLNAPRGSGIADHGVWSAEHGSWDSRSLPPDPIDPISANVSSNNDEKLQFSFPEQPQPPTQINIGKIKYRLGSELDFDHSPFEIGYSKLQDKNKTKAFLAPIAEYINKHPEFVIGVTIIVRTTGSNPDFLATQNNFESNITTRDFVNERGKAIMRVLIDLGIDPKIIIYQTKFGQPNINTSIKLKVEPR